MTRRSKNPPELLAFDNTQLARIERETRRVRQDTNNTGPARSINMENEQPEFADANAAPDPPRPISNNNQAMFDQDAQPARRTIGDFRAPTAFFASRLAIRPPPVNINDYEIKSSIIKLVKLYQFHDLPNEHPMDHIDSFEEICITTRSKGVPADFLKCKLFAFSLIDKAHRWLKSLPPDSLTTWDECKASFLSQFYTKSNTTMLKNHISSFQQTELEPFFEAWECFKEYVRDCPHHVYPEEQRLGIFYDGVDWRISIALDSGSNGSFMTKTVMKHGSSSTISHPATTTTVHNTIAVEDVLETPRQG